MRFKGAIFDMDGLLFDTERIYQETWQEIAIENNVGLDGSFLRAISGTNGERMRHTVEKYYHVADGTAIMQDCMERVRMKLSVNVPMKKGVHGILRMFHEKNICMAVASSSSVQQIQSNLQTAGIRAYFSTVVSGAEIRQGKPAPDIFLLAARRLGCSPNECFVFEDSENGIRAGHAAGCCTVMVPDLMEASPDIMPYCTKVCDDLQQAGKEIKEMLEQ